MCFITRIPKVPLLNIEVNFEIVQPNALINGTIEHYHFLNKEYDRIKNLSDNATGEKAEELYFELEGITMYKNSYYD